MQQNNIVRKRNSIEFKVWGKYALFSDPITRVGGEKMSYMLPTYEAIKGITESIYWKPTIIWFVDYVRVMKRIRTESKAIKTLKFSVGEKKGINDLSYYTYLRDVCYQVIAHFEWNENYPDLMEDRNENKHHNIARRSVEKGGRRDIFLGTRECQGYVESCSFGDDDGEYDDIEELSAGPMFHGFDYPNETGKNELSIRFWRPIMRNGIISFPKPADCPPELRKYVNNMSMKSFLWNENFNGLKNEQEV